MSTVVSIPDAVAIEIAGQCDRGKVREENQDTVRHTSTSLGDLLVVADGVGGFSGGGEASQIAVDTISSSVEGMPAFFPPDIAVEEALCRANAAISATASEPDSKHPHMATTAVVALLRSDPDRAHAPVTAIIGHVGDSRAYLVHNQTLTRLTRDHSVVQEMLDNREITPEQAEDHPDASTLTRCLGLETNVLVAMREVPLEVGDTLLLCSDGLWGYVEEAKIERVLADPQLSTEAASQALIDLALEAGGHDNVGIQVARIGVPQVRPSARKLVAVPATPDPAPAAPLRPAPPVAIKPEPRPSPVPAAAPAWVSVPASKPASVAHETLRIFEPQPRPAPMAESLPIFRASAAAIPESAITAKIDAAKTEAAQPSPVPAFRSAPPPVVPHVSVIELLSTLQTDTARFADSMMLPELIVVPNKMTPVPAQSSFVSHSASARPQVGVARLAAIFALAFTASTTLAYFAIVNNWFHLVR